MEEPLAQASSTGTAMEPLEPQTALETLLIGIFLTPELIIMEGLVQQKMSVLPITLELKVAVTGHLQLIQTMTFGLEESVHQVSIKKLMAKQEIGSILFQYSVGMAH